MAYGKKQRQYLEMGRCVDCGGERMGGDAATKTKCAMCANKRKTREQKHWAARQTANVCTVCGKSKTGRARSPLRCGVCILKQRKASAVYEQRKRNRAAGYTEGDGRDVKKWPMGAASTAKREGGEFNFSLTLDRPSLEALLVIKKRYRDAEWKAGRVPQTHQLSRLVREIIVKYEPNRAVVKPRKHRLLVEMKANLSLDGRTRAVLERQAALSFNGNKSATLRAMLIECQGFRRAFTGSSLPKGVPVVFEPALPFPVRHVVDP